MSLISSDTDVPDNIEYYYTEASEEDEPQGV